MYSKDRGITRPSPRPYGDRHPISDRPPMGDRPPLGDRQPAYRQSRPERVQVPPNYSGHAIVDGEERPLGTLQAETETALPAPHVPTPHFDGLPRVSTLTDPPRARPRTLPAAFEVSEEPHEEPPSTEESAPDAIPTASPEARATPQPPPSPTVQAPPRVSLFDGTKFPFGHGIGLEELLILGLILFLLRESGDGEDRGDLDETVVLLGLLLLLG